MLAKTESTEPRVVNGINVDDLLALIEGVRRDAAEGNTKWRLGILHRRRGDRKQAQEHLTTAVLLENTPQRCFMIVAVDAVGDVRRNGMIYWPEQAEAVLRQLDLPERHCDAQPTARQVSKVLRTRNRDREGLSKRQGLTPLDMAAGVTRATPPPKERPQPRWADRIHSFRE